MAVHMATNWSFEIKVNQEGFLSGAGHQESPGEFPVNEVKVMLFMPWTKHFEYRQIERCHQEERRGLPESR